MSKEDYYHKVMVKAGYFNKDPHFAKCSICDKIFLTYHKKSSICSEECSEKEFQQIIKTLPKLEGNDNE